MTKGTPVVQAEDIELEGTSLKEENDPEMPKEMNEEIKEAVEVELDSGCNCSSIKSKKALKASYLSCLGLMAIFFIVAGAGMHEESGYDQPQFAPEAFFLLAVLLYTTITILSFFMKRPEGALQLTAFGLFSGACLFWFIAAIAIFFSSSSSLYTFCAMGLLGSISNIAAICLLFTHALRQEDSTIGLFSSLGMFVFVLANLLFLGAFGTFITAANNANNGAYGTYENAVGLVLSGAVMFFFHFIFEILSTFLPGIIMKIEIRNINAEPSS